MAVNVETLEKLERRITLTLAASEINSEVEARLKKLARTVKADGFRPGKVPMSSSPSATATRAVRSDERQAGPGLCPGRQRSPAARGRRAQHHPEGRGAEGQMAFDATFEVYPEVKIGDLSTAEVER
jgi:trigger factor